MVQALRGDLRARRGAPADGTGHAASAGPARLDAPWFFTNDSTYQIEQGGDLLLHLDNPYGHDYRQSGLERFYTRDGSVSEEVREREVALRHFAYFPGTVYVAAAWRFFPSRSTTTGC